MFREDFSKYMIINNLSQTEVAEKLGVSQQSVSNFLNSERKLQESMRRKITNGFPDFVEYTRRSRRLVPQNFPVDDDLNQQINVELFSEIDKQGQMFVPLVSKFAYLDFSKNYLNPDYIEHLPSVPYSFDELNGGDHICVEVKSGTMDDSTSSAIKIGDLLLCRKLPEDIEGLELVQKIWNLVIVHKYLGLLIGKVDCYSTEKEQYKISFTNSIFESQLIDKEDVLAFYKLMSLKRII